MNRMDPCEKRQVTDLTATQADPFYAVDTRTTAKPETILVLAFEKAKTVSVFSKKQSHSNIEIFLIPTPCPTLPEPGCKAKSYDFTTRDILAIRIDRLQGVRSSIKRNDKINGESHDTLCIPLSEPERLNVVDFIHSIKDCRHNLLDELLSRTVPNIAKFMTTDPDSNQNHLLNETIMSCSRTITKLHAGQLVTLIIQRCLHDRKVTSKMWGCNDRFSTPHTIYKELVGVCLAINPDAFRQGYVQAWGLGHSRRGPDKC
jgi:hypothetical protein